MAVTVQVQCRLFGRATATPDPIVMHFNRVPCIGETVELLETAEEWRVTAVYWRDTADPLIYLSLLA